MAPVGVEVTERAPGGPEGSGGGAVVVGGCGMVVGTVGRDTTVRRTGKRAGGPAERGQE